MNKNWNCSYIAKPHEWSVDDNQTNTGAEGVRVHCLNCPQLDTLPAPYAHQYLINARRVVADAINQPPQQSVGEKK